MIIGLAEKLIKLREQQGISQQELSEKLKVSKSTYIRLENEKTQ